MTKRPLILSLLALALLGSPFYARAEAGDPSGLVVVVNSNSGIDRLTHDDIVNIFLGRYRRLPTGLTAQPIDLPEDSRLKERFYRKLVNKNLNEISAYWARLVFSGKTSPPRQAGSAQDALKLVLQSKGAITYAERSQLDSRFKVVLDLNQ